MNTMEVKTARFDRTAYMRRYYAEHRDELREYQRHYIKEHMAARVNYFRAYRASNRKKFAARQVALRIVRKELGLTQKAAGKILGVSQVTVCNWENGSAFCDVDYAIKKLRKAVGV